MRFAIRTGPDTNAAHPPDVDAFVETLESLENSPNPVLRRLFVTDRNLHLARAPGRLDVMGGFADYSGSLVLQLPITEAAVAAAQIVPEPVVRAVSLSPEGARHTSFSTRDLERWAGAGYEEARAHIAAGAGSSWAGYVIGCVVVLMREANLRLREGVSILIDSNVPEGKGVASSAAVEVATMQAVASASGLELDPETVAGLCQKTENHVVAAPCGIMDQMTVACGRAGHLLELLCQPARIVGHVPVPDSLAFWGIDSGLRHAVMGADYGLIRTAAFMGYRIIAELAGFAVRQEPDGRVRIEDTAWDGYLVNLNPTEFVEQFSDHMPRWITGNMFIQRYGGTTDPATRVNPETVYPVRRATRHPIFEHFRVRVFAELLAGGAHSDRARRTLGKLMLQSHAGYSECGLGSTGTDRLAALVRQRGFDSGLYGARITGGGSGGVVAVLGRADALEAAQAVAHQYAAETGRAAVLFSGSSPGAGTFGTRVLQPDGISD